jgi:hypothetical protein
LRDVDLAGMMLRALPVHPPRGEERWSARLQAIVEADGHRRLGGFGTDSSQTPRWRELDSNLRFRARAGSILPVRFVADSLLEGDGFEPSVPRPRRA